MALRISSTSSDPQSSISPHFFSGTQLLCSPLSLNPFQHEFLECRRFFKISTIASLPLPRIPPPTVPVFWYDALAVPQCVFLKRSGTSTSRWRIQPESRRPSFGGRCFLLISLYVYFLILPFFKGTPLPSNLGRLYGPFLSGTFIQVIDCGVDAPLVSLRSPTVVSPPLPGLSHSWSEAFFFFFRLPLRRLCRLRPCLTQRMVSQLKWGGCRSPLTLYFTFWLHPPTFCQFFSSDIRTFLSGTDLTPHS